MKRNKLDDMIGNIAEEFKTSFKMKFAEQERYVEIFVNPTPKEIRETINSTTDNLPSLRYIATPNKKVYIYPGDILHMRVAPEVGVEYDKSIAIMGYIIYKENDFTPSKFGSYHLHDVITDKFVISKILETDWTWLEKYFPGYNSWFKGYKAFIKKTILKERK